MKVPELKEACRAASLPVGGTKMVLIEKLTAHKEGEKAEQGKEKGGKGSKRSRKREDEGGGDGEDEKNGASKLASNSLCSWWLQKDGSKTNTSKPLAPAKKPVQTKKGVQDVGHDFDNDPITSFDDESIGDGIGESIGESIGDGEGGEARELPAYLDGGEMVVDRSAATADLIDEV
jgi:hypothetical protein